MSHDGIFEKRFDKDCLSNPMEGLRVDQLAEALARIKELKAIVRRQYSERDELVREIIELRDRIRELENNLMLLPELPDGCVYDAVETAWYLGNDDIWRASIFIASEREYVCADGDSPRAAALAAIAKIEGGAE